MLPLPRYIIPWKNITKLNLRNLSNGFKGCWKCNHTETRNNFFCASCGVIRDIPTNVDFFNLLNQAKKFKIDQAKLTQHFHQAQNAVHPDKFSQSSDKEKDLASKWSSLINKAFKTLSKTTDRGKYLLQLNGIAISEDNSTIDQAFLLKMMEINESVDEAETTNELEKIRNNVTQDVEELTEDLVKFFEAKDMEAAKQAIIRLKYLQNIVETIKEKKLHLSLA